jgi:uncharacterized protein (TIGR00156 family)
MLIATGLVNKTNSESVSIMKTDLAKDFKKRRENDPVPYKVKEIKNNAIKLDRSDTDVKLTGNIVDQIDPRHYWFEDDTGRIIIDIRGRIIPFDDFDAETLFIIIGEVDYDYLDGLEIEVEQIKVFAEGTEE